MPDPFDLWMNRVDQFVTHSTGLSIHDLSDLPFRDYFDDGMSPEEVAEVALIENGWES